MISFHFFFFWGGGQATKRSRLGSARLVPDFNWAPYSDTLGWQKGVIGLSNSWQDGLVERSTCKLGGSDRRLQQDRPEPPAITNIGLPGVPGNMEIRVRPPSGPEPPDMINIGLPGVPGVPDWNVYYQDGVLERSTWEHEGSGPASTRTRTTSRSISIPRLQVSKYK